MNPMQAMMMCRTCPDKRRVASAANDARRILSRLEQLIGEKAPSARGARQAYFDSHYSCRYTGSSCSDFRRGKSELDMSERRLEDAFSSLLNRIASLKEEGAEDEAKKFKRQAHDLVRGHYPKAARKLEET